MNFGTPVPLLVGIILILFSVFLFFLEKFKPGYKRDSDVIYASFCLAAGILNLVDLSGGFLHASQSVIFTGLFISLALEAINARVPDNSPKSMGMPRDDDRSPRNYRAGFEDNFGAMDDRNSGRQMGGGGRRGRDEFEPRSSNRMESGRPSDSSRGDNSGRGDSGRTESGRSERDRFLEDRPRRRSSSRDDEPMSSPDSDRSSGRGSERGTSRRGRDEFGDDIGPRSIPERSSASDMGSRSNPSDRRGSSPNNNQDVDDVPRPRRRPDDNESPRGRRPSSESVAPASDYLEFRPVEPIPPKESWGPKE